MNKILSNKKYILAFVMPAFLVYFLFSLVPIFYNFYISLFKTDLMSPSVFVGLRNYSNLLKDSTFMHALANNLIMVVGSLLAHMPLALLFAAILFQKIKGAKFFQIVFFLPSVICGVAVGLTWTFIYHSEFGLLNGLLDLLRLSSLKNQWLANPDTVLLCIVAVVMWQFVGYHMIIQLAAMKNIPGSLYEAAEIDGASKFRQFTSITFPLIKNILGIDAVLIITGSLKYYDLVAVMTGGGPNHASELLSTYMYYQGFRTLKYGYSAAIGIVLLLLCVISVAISNRVFKSEKIEY